MSSKHINNNDAVVKELQNNFGYTQQIDYCEKTQKNEVLQFITDANSHFLLKTLSPEIQENEKKKRKHKDWLMFAMGIFLLMQFVLVSIIVIGSGFWIIKSHIEKNPFPDSTIKLIFTFIGAYITSVVVELIAILKYIVKNVFDTSISGLVNNYVTKDGVKH